MELLMLRLMIMLLIVKFVLLIMIIIMTMNDDNDDDDIDDNDNDVDNVDSSLCGQRRGEYVGNLGIHTCLSITFTFFNIASDFNFLSACTCT